MDAIAGLRPATGGQVLYNGEDLAVVRDRYRHSLGYVPQDDIIHRELPLRATLEYAARLRLPLDTTRADRAAAVDHALSALQLTRVAGRPGRTHSQAASASAHRSASSC